MSETVKTLSKAAVTKLYAPFVDAITEAAKVLASTEAAVTLSRIALGRIVAEAVTALTTAGASADEAQTRILATVQAAYPNVTEYATVNAWVRAATVADSLPVEYQESFSTEALVTLGRVKPEDRATFVEVATESGITSVRGLREAVNAHNAAEGGTARGKKRNATQAADAVKALDTFAKNDANVRPDGDADEAVLVWAMVQGWLLGKKCPKFNRQAIIDACEEFLGPDIDTDGDDSDQ
jgi:hypothetical protein